MSLNPTKGHEQQGRRPVLVVSNDIINSKLVLALIVPITTTNRNIPLHVLIPNEYSTKIYVKCEEIRAVDLTHRNDELLLKAYFTRYS